MTLINHERCAASTFSVVKPATCARPGCITVKRLCLVTATAEIGKTLSLLYRQLYRRCKVSALLVLPLIAAAQLTPNSVTVTASRNLNPQADQIQFRITINSATTATLDDVLAVAKGAGLTQENFRSVTLSSSDVVSEPVEWSFAVATALSNMKSTTALLTAMQTSLAQEGKYSLSFLVQGTRVSQQAQQSQTCPMADLIADARAQASRLVSAAGLTLGAIQAISSPTIVSGGSPALGAATPTSVPTCTVTAKFAFGGL